MLSRRASQNVQDRVLERRREEADFWSSRGSCGRGFVRRFERRSRQVFKLIRAGEVADFRFSGGAERLNFEDF